VQRSRDWILVLDDALFEVPFAALVADGRFLVERHSIRLLPSAFMLRERAPRDEGRQGFVAFGDAIYNRADSRRRAGAGSGTKLELPRIPASGTEARQCAEQWKHGSATLLVGADANRDRLERALRDRPAALHMAVHVIGTENGGRALIGLGLDAAGQPHFLDAEEISRKRFEVPMVVLSGCSSGRGRVLPGAGLTGLTRAWLLGGSQTVLASHWPTADDTGALFAPYYREIARSDAPLSANLSARALQTAQLEMLSSGSWRAEPRYWAAFFVTGRD
jgi:CHAT domain-containing protein